MSEKRRESENISEIETILLQKAEKLPTPKSEWGPENKGTVVEFKPQEKQKEQQKHRRKGKTKWCRWVAVAAILVVLVGVGVSAKDNGKTYYGMWSGIQWSRSDMWAKDYLSGKYNVVLPGKLGEYKFESIEQTRNGYELKKNGEIGWFDILKSFLDVKYRSLWITYKNGEKEKSREVGNITVYGYDDISLSIGPTTMEYWSTFYSFNPETMEWEPEGERYRDRRDTWYEDVRTEEYKGITVYLATLCHDQTEEIMGNHIEGVTRSQVAHWIDEEKQLCYALHGSRYSDVDIMIMVKQLIDAQEE